jgi:hypothetical protein
MDTGSEFLNQSSRRFAESFGRIRHAVNQLGGGDIWRRPSETSNSIGIIVQHLTGNLNQWICSALGGDPDTRKRFLEFSTESFADKKEMMSGFEELGSRVLQIIGALPAASLLDAKRIQGREENTLSAIYKACTHLEIHAGQIMYIAKLILGDKYTEFWRPSTHEEGLP